MVADGLSQPQHQGTAGQGPRTHASAQPLSLHSGFWRRKDCPKGLLLMESGSLYPWGKVRGTGLMVLVTPWVGIRGLSWFLSLLPPQS